MNTRTQSIMLALALSALVPATTWAQPSILAAVQAERAKYGPTMSKAQIGAMLDAVAGSNKGWVLLSKPNGNNCPSRDGSPISCDYLVYESNGQGFDVLRESDDNGPAVPQWSPGDRFGRDRYVYPSLTSVDQGGSPGDSGGIPISDGLASFIPDVRASLGRVEHNQDALQRSVDAMADRLRQISDDVQGALDAAQKAQHAAESAPPASPEASTRPTTDKPWWADTLLAILKYGGPALAGVVGTIAVR